MRCLQCGSTLSAFKKLTDSDFCSAEHRDAFYGEQQKLIIARLQQSASRFTRKPRGTASGPTVPVAAATAAPPVEEAQAPAKIAPFRYEIPDLADRISRVSFSLSILASEGQLSLPVRATRQSDSGLLATLVRDLPWPRYNTGLKAFLSLIDPAHEFDVPQLSLGGELNRGLSLCGRQPDLNLVALNLQLQRPIALRILRPKPSIAVDHLQSARTKSANQIRLSQRSPSRKPNTVAPPAHELFLDASALPVTARAARKSTVQLDVDRATRGIAFLDRVYRMRPRAAVLPASLPAMTRSALLPAGLTPGNPHLPYAPQGQPQSFVPLGSSRLFRTAIRSGVSVSAAASVSVQAGDALGMNSARPSLALPFELLQASPSRIDRFFRPRPRGPMMDGALPEFEQLAAQPVGFVSHVLYGAATSNAASADLQPSRHKDAIKNASVQKPMADARLMAMSGQSESIAIALDASKPSLTVPGQTFEPTAVTRMFKWRPRGPLAGNWADLELVDAVNTTVSLTPSVGELPRPQFEFEPAGDFRLIRTRLRNGVPSASISDLNPPSTPVAFSGSAAIPSASGVTEFAPAPITRMFRMRPRTSMDCATPSMQVEAIGHGSVSAGPIELPHGIAYPLSAEVAFLDRLYRPRLRNSVASATSEWTPIETGEVFLAKLSGVLPAFRPIPALLAPNSVERFFRPRPKAGVPDPAIASAMIPTVSAEALSPENAIPSMEIGDCEPMFASKPFRMRMRAGVDSDSARRLETAPTSNVYCSLSPAMPGVESTRSIEIGGCEPMLASKLFRMRMRAGVDSESDRRFEAAPTSRLDSSLSPAILGLEVADAGEFAPAFVSRMFRGRPRAGAPSDYAPSFRALNAEALPYSLMPAVQHVGLSELTPSPVNRLVRVRPKAGVDATTARTMGRLVPAEFKGEQMSWDPDWWDMSRGLKPLFLNRMYRVRLKNPAEDPETHVQSIRTKHVPTPESEPVIAGMPPNSIEAGFGLLDRLYRMRPRSGKTIAPTTAEIPCKAIEPRSPSGSPTTVLASVSKQWKASPLTIKSLTATISALLLLAVLPIGGQGKPTQPERVMRQALLQRAAIDESDSFNGGLQQWVGAEGWTQTPSGAVKPGKLGLFRPSLDLTDYEMEFLAQIEKKGFGFVVRAKDEKNYVAIRLITLNPGPMPQMGIVRYTVIDGKETGRQQLPLLLNVSDDTVYRVRVEVNRQSFTLMIQDRVVDSWTEEHLQSGGAGFFCAKGERALVQQIRLSHQNDTIGKLLAALPLKQVHSSNGSEQ